MKKIDGNLKYAVFFDIDGTLLGSSDAALRENIRTVNAVRAMGHKVFVATGRAMSFIPDFIKNGSDFDGIDNPVEFGDASGLPQLYDGLVKAGFSEDDADRIFYKNVMRVYREIL